MQTPPLIIAEADGAEAAWLYELTHRGNDGDAAFYSAWAAGSSSTLELGSGFGRLLHPLAASCGDVWGVEFNPHALDRARDRVANGEHEGEITLRLDDVCSMDLGRQFARIAAPYNLFFNLGGEAGVREALATAYRHLELGGQLAFDVYLVPEEGFGPAAPQPEPWEIRFAALDGPIRIDLYDSQQNLEGDSLAMHYAYYVCAPDKAPRWVRTSISHDYLRPSQLLRAVVDAGFTIDTVYGDFEGHSLAEAQEQVVVVARKGPAEAGE